MSGDAISTMCAYPLAKVRIGMPMREYVQYKKDWAQFNKVWIYNYTVSTLNGLSGTPTYAPYKFSTPVELISYSSGQSAHVAYYTEAAAANVFNNFY